MANGIFSSLVKCLADCFERVKEMVRHLLIENIQMFLYFYFKGMKQGHSIFNLIVLYCSFD